MRDNQPLQAEPVVHGVPRQSLGTRRVEKLTALLALLLFTIPAFASDLDEFRIKREQNFEFAAKPVVERNGDQFVIRFAASSRCDATVVIENGEGRIVRHLASGVLGANAPAPFQKNSVAQRLIWDGKNDEGAYIDDIASHTVRVSLGLKAAFDKNLLWEPKVRMHQDASLMAAAAEGVYVYDGRVLDKLVLYNRDGEYVRTVYPFPASKLADVRGLHLKEFPQDGRRLPLMEGFHQATFLSSGENAGFDEGLQLGVDRHNNYHGSVWGNAASMLAVRGERIALGRLRLNRLATDGSTGGQNLHGPDITFSILPKGNIRRGELLPVEPRSAALSPDGRYLYLTGYVFPHSTTASRDIVLISHYDWLPGVARLDFAAGDQTEVFLGGMQLEDDGTGNTQFKTPTSIAVDASGRLYVSDFVNDRVQVFSPDGKLLKSIAVSKPAQVVIHQQSRQIYVFSWWISNRYLPAPKESDSRRGKLPYPPTLTVLESFDNPQPVLQCELPIRREAARSNGFVHRAEVDGWSDPPRIWLCSEWGRLDILTRANMQRTNIQVYELDAANSALKPVRDFNQDAAQSVVRTDFPEYARQRLFVNPADRMLYVAEGQSAVGKSTRELIRIDPDTGAVKLVPLPFDAEDLCFDLNGLAYLRTFYYVARFDTRDWSEVPWDYGEELASIRTTSSNDGRTTPVKSALPLPVKHAGLHHHGGMAVSANGSLIVAVNNHEPQPGSRKDVYDQPALAGGTAYTPPAFPGRARWGEVHVWDRYGQILFEDALPGLAKTDGVGLDADNNLYLLSTTTRILDGQRYFNDMTGTLLKVRPQSAKVVSNTDRAVVPLGEDLKPARPPEIANSIVNQAWVEGAEWFYGGVGFSGKNAGRSGGGCDCYNARFTLDFLRRSFAPEIGRHSIAVLDASGNLMLRIGQYGNADSSGPDSPQPLGGDEVGLFYAPYVAADTDRRLFIADPGNSRIVSVKLDYHSSEKVRLK